MITADIKSIDKVFHQETSQYFLDVVLDVKQDGVSVLEKRLGFPLDADKNVILGAIADFCGSYQTNVEIADRNKPLDVANEKADTTIADLVGKSVTAEDTTTLSEPTI